jgi:transglutaminase-like putative cysteine protease
MRWLRAVPVPLVLAGMLALSGVALGRIYNGPLLAQLVAGAAVGSVLVSVACQRLPTWLVAPLSVLALAGYTAFALNLAAQRAALPGTLGEIASDAVRNGIPRLLSALIPVEPQPDTVLVPVVATWLAGLAAAELAVRGGRVLLGYAPPTLLFAGTLYVVGPNAQTATWPALGYVALAAAGLAATGRSGNRGLPELEPSARAAMRLRLGASTAAGLAVIIAVAAAVGPAVAERVHTTPVDPRQYVTPPQVDALDENPLSRISGWALNPDQHLLDVNLPGGQPATDTRIRLAVLNDYDGVTWHVGATYRSAGRVLPEPPADADIPAATDSAAGRLRQDITVADLTGKLLPAVPTPREVDGVRVAYDQGSGTVIRPEGLAPGLRYEVSSAPEHPNVNLLAAADVPSGPSVARVLALGEGVPTEIQSLADQISKASGAAYDRAQAIEQFLSEHYRLVADAPSGHAYPNLNFFLFGPTNAGGQRGTSEQFAASFAVLGRLMGLPTRVVVGFDLKAGAHEVHGSDAFAWPEVLFSGVGWVSFDPLPRPKTQPRPVEEDFHPKPDTSTPPPSEAPTPSLSPTASASASASAAAAAPASVPTVPLVTGGLVTVLVLALTGFAVTVPMMRRAQRRRRLDEGAPDRRVAGAWLEVSDALRLAGRPAQAHLDATEVATHAAVAAGLPRAAHRGERIRLAVPPIDDLATLVNQATFAPSTTDDAQARRAGAQAIAYVAELRARRPWWRRLLWTVHPGPLRWHR